MRPARLFISVLLIGASYYCKAQTDSSLQSLQEVPLKYIHQVDSKIDKYTNRITNRTEKTLSKLAKWESKIKTVLEKASPETAQRLFANNQLTFAGALEKYKKGEAIVTEQRAKYDAYRDKLSTSLGYLEQQKDKLDAKLVNPIKAAKQKAEELNKQEDNTEAMEQFIKERRKQLINESIKYIGNSKYLTKISSETGLYIAAVQNYRELLHNPKKAEETALTILNKIPGFSKFVQQNGMLAKLFGSPSTGGAAPNLAGLQTRASVNTLIQNQIAAGGPSAAAQIRQNIQEAQTQLNALKDKVLKAGGNSSGNEALTEEYGKFPQQKAKTFFQRISLGTDMGFVKDNALMPTVANLALSATYKLTENKQFGVALAYKAGLGSINHIQITHQGVGMRSFASLKLKKSFWATGGWEANQNAGFKNIQQLKDYSMWTQSALVGIEKKMNIKTKWFNGSKVSLLWDCLANQRIPVGQPIVFRVGYSWR